MFTRLKTANAERFASMYWLKYGACVLCVSLLSACGGGEPDNGSQTVDLGELANEESLPLGTFSFPIDELNYNFDQIHHMQYWMADATSEPVFDVEFAWLQDVGRFDNSDLNDRGASVLAPTWVSDQDTFKVEVSFMEDVVGPPENEIDMEDMTCGSVRYSMWFPTAEAGAEVQDYIQDGNLQFRFFMKDAADVKAYLTQYTAGEIADFAAPNVNDAGWYDFLQENLKVDDLEAGEGFDLTQVSGIGVEFKANGKPIEVADPFLLDNISLTPAVIQNCLVTVIERQIVGDSFDDSLGDWQFSYSNGLDANVMHSADVGQPPGAMVFALNWADAANDKIGWERDIGAENIVNLQNLNLGLDVFLPEEYINDGNLALKVFLKDSEFRFADFGEMRAVGFNAGWNSISLTNIQPDDIAFSQTGFNVNQIRVIGLEIAAAGKPNSVTGDIVVDNYRIFDIVEGDAGAVLSFNFEDAAQVDEQWRQSWVQGGLSDGDVVVSHDSENEAMAFDVAWESSSNGFGWETSLAAPIDIIGKVVLADVYMPAAYVTEGNLAFKIFTKDNSESFLYGSFHQYKASEFNADDWTTLEISVTADAFDFQATGYDSSNVGTLGVQMDAQGKPADVTGTILVDNVKIIDPTLGASSAISVEFEAIQ